jgi:hypothetical protein
MKRCTFRVSLALTVLAVLSLIAAAAAQQRPASLVPLTFAFRSTGNNFTIPVDPPVVSTRLFLTNGQSDLLGPFRGIGHVINHLGPDGQLAYNDGGVVALTGANGDAIFYTYAGVVSPATTPSVRRLAQAATITGGTGRFAGATGSGILTIAIDLSNGQATGTFAGMITTPKT